MPLSHDIEFRWQSLLSFEFLDVCLEALRLLNPPSPVNIIWEMCTYKSNISEVSVVDETLTVKRKLLVTRERDLSQDSFCWWQRVLLIMNPLWISPYWMQMFKITQEKILGHLRASGVVEDEWDRTLHHPAGDTELPSATSSWNSWS